MNTLLRNLQTRLDRQAIDQLRVEVARLSKLLDDAIDRAETAEYRLAQADSDAMQMHDLAMELMHETDQRIGITQDGAIGIIRE